MSHHQKLLRRRRFLKSISLAALSTVVLTIIKRVEADVPDVQQIENISQDTTGRVRVQIRHSNPTGEYGGHYIDIVEVDIDGQIKQFNMQPQNTDPFTEELDLGGLYGLPNVKARAHCTVHGWGAWSNQIQIPEFPSAALAILAALAASLFLLKKRGRT